MYVVQIFLSVLCFILMVSIALYAPGSTEGELGLKMMKSEEPYIPTSLGYSAVIIILYNTVSWPQIKANITKKSLFNDSEVKARVKVMLNELNVIVNFVVNLMAAMTAIEKKEDFTKAFIKVKTHYDGSFFHMFASLKDMYNYKRVSNG